MHKLYYHPTHSPTHICTYLYVCLPQFLSLCHVVIEYIYYSFSILNFIMSLYQSYKQCLCSISFKAYQNEMSSQSVCLSDLTTSLIGRPQLICLLFLHLLILACSSSASFQTSCLVLWCSGRGAETLNCCSLPLTTWAGGLESFRSKGQGKAIQ